MTHVVLVTGTSGAGRTTAAAATALAAARSGRGTLLLCAERPGDAETILGPGTPPALTLHQVRARAAVEDDLFAARDRLAPVLALTGLGTVERCEVPVLPGLTELATLRALAAAAASGAHDVVVADLPEADRAATLLALPATARRLLDRGLPPERRAARQLHPLLAAVAGLPPPAPWTSGAAARAAAELDRLRAAVDGPGTRVVLVQRPGAVAARAARRGLAALALHGHLPDAIVVNGGEATPVHDAPHVATVPSPGREITGAEALAAWAGRAGTLAVLDAPRAGGSAGTVERDGDRYELVLPLPGAERRDLDLVRHGDDLVVTVGEHRRALPLPSALRGGWLRVRFTPDPDVWMRTRP